MLIHEFNTIVDQFTAPQFASTIIAPISSDTMITDIVTIALFAPAPWFAVLTNWLFLGS